MDIDVATLKTLRMKTEAGLLDCKRALAEAGGELEAATALLSSWGLAGVERRAERETCEGRIFIDREGQGATCLRLACETDFVALNPGFVALGEKLARLAREGRLESPDSEMEALVAAFAGTVKENLVIGGLRQVEAQPGEWLEAYLHGEGRIGVLLVAKVEPEPALADAEVVDLVHGLALHVAAFAPSFLDGASLSGAELDAMRAAIAEEIAGDGALMAKPERIREGAAAGRLRKRLAERSLLDHPYVKDEGRTVREAIQGLEARKGVTLSVRSFACLKVEED